MSRTYNIECSCGCLIAEAEFNDGNVGYIPCRLPECKAEEEYWKDHRKKLKEAKE
jgi:hypothetical protein